MDIATITTLVGSLGFPIAVCIACFWFINKTLNNITQALNNNTAVMQKFISEDGKGGK